jgi:hypothetical protein
MKGRYDLFGYLTIAGITAVLSAAAASIIFQSWPLGEKLIMLGIWLIVSFLVLVGVEGNARGIARNKVKVPWKWAMISFLCAGVLFVLAGVVGIT